MAKNKAQTLTLDDLVGVVIIPPQDEKNNGNGNGDKSAMGPAALEIPEPPSFPKISAPVDYEEQGARMREGRTAIATGIDACLSELDSISHLTTEEARYLAAPRVAELKKVIQGSLGHVFPPYRRAAWVALIRHELASNLSTPEEVGNLLDRLVSEGRLFESPPVQNPPIRPIHIKAYGKAYAINPDSLLEEPDIEEVKKALGGLLNRVYQEVGKARQAQAELLAKQGTISLSEFLAGKTGRIFLVVPPTEVFGGTKFWRGGGSLLLNSDGEEIRPLGASGSIEPAIQEAIELKVFLKLYTIGWTKPPVVPGLTPEMGKKVQLLWHLIARVIETAQKEQRAHASHSRLLERATVTTEEWFQQRAIGICALQFPNWEVKGAEDGNVIRRIRDLLVLVARRDDGTILIVEAQATEPFGNLFDSCRDPYEVVGEKFEGVPYPLRAILQAGYGQALKASQDTVKAQSIHS